MCCTIPAASSSQGSGTATRSPCAESLGEIMSFTRRFTLGTLFGGGALAGGASFGQAAAPDCPASHASNRARGVEGQRKADLGNGTFLNPIVPGDHPDPSI